MARWLKTSDFDKYRYAIAQTDKSDTELLTYIEDVEVRYLQDLFGAVLYKAFIADLVNNVPQAAKFVAVFNAFFEDNDDNLCHLGRTRRSEGIIEMLRYFTFMEFIRDQKFVNTTVGTVLSVEENSEHVSFDQEGVKDRYNRGQESYEAIQQKMIEDSSTYDDFNGEPKEPIGIL